MILNAPCILEETDDFAVVYKPPEMHSSPLKKESGITLVDWFAAENHADGKLEKSKLLDNGLMHRLDFDTHGLVLFAKNEKSFEFFKSLQNSGSFVKEYSAVCTNAILVNDSAPAENCAEGFPPPPVITNRNPSQEKPLIITSYFRPFGPGRKEVRPVINEKKKSSETAKDNGGFYRTEITGTDNNIFTVRIKRGFRHQIRCHLCWIGCPILGDPLYTRQVSNEQPLALRAHAIFFTDPSSGKQRECRISPISQ